MWLVPLLVLSWITKINSNKWQSGPCSLHYPPHLRISGVSSLLPFLLRTAPPRCGGGASLLHIIPPSTSAWAWPLPPHLLLSPPHTGRLLLPAPATVSSLHRPPSPPRAGNRLLPRGGHLGYPISSGRVIQVFRNSGIITRYQLQKNTTRKFEYPQKSGLGYPIYLKSIITVYTQSEFFID
jgi:hypothetical protein